VLHNDPHFISIILLLIHNCMSSLQKGFVLWWKNSSTALVTTVLVWPRGFECNHDISNSRSALISFFPVIVRQHGSGLDQWPINGAINLAT
jgi:hypothetical protein